ncbi:hypothetical protein SAMN05660236_4777 [Ohtaekwangia koreensis]|uniref:Uncharacterized protein n=1 Tax=Ohtaekwangia koreensis TaxID=688867 RepID=A0A1T5M9S8_9BACT|nr:hypothetical protein SAMN05660236_4777 [Ohtaekwangia koreensis]
MTICTVVVIISCENSKITDSRPEIFFLQDSLFRIEINVPMELDSFNTWVDYDDTSCGHLRKYRFSNSNYPIIQESGFIHKTSPDSSYRLTFSHIDNYNCQDSTWKVDLKGVVKGLELRSKMDSVQFRLISLDKVEINKLTFDILTFKTDLLPRQKYQSILIWGFTKVNGIDLKVEYECANKNCDSFIDKMNESLKSLRVTK